MTYGFPSHYRVVETVRDGNCLFAAIAHQLGRPMTDCDQVRHEIVNYFRENHSHWVCLHIVTI